MPLHKGASKKAREANIRTEIAAGKSPKQAVAIGYSEQRAAEQRNKHQHRKVPHPTKGSHEA